jgi:hypothetical protein
VYTVEQGDGTSFAVATLAGVAALWLAHHGPAAIKQKYGSSTQEVFRMLVTLTCRTPAGWDSSRYGAGIVDAEALLKAPLPPRPALAMAAGAGPAEEALPDQYQGALGQLAATWSDRSIADIERSLTAKLAGPAASAFETAGQSATLARYASELRYLAGEDPLLHQALVPPPAELIERLAAPAAVQDTIDLRVRSGVSRGLAEALGG